MTQLFSESEKQLLSQLLRNTVFQKAVTNALAEAIRRKRGNDSLEGSAMAFQYQEGAREIVETIYGYAEIQQSPTILPRKLIHHYSNQ